MFVDETLEKTRIEYSSFRRSTVSSLSRIEVGMCAINWTAASIWLRQGNGVEAWRSKAHFLKYNGRGVNDGGESTRFGTYGSPVTAEALNAFQWISRHLE